MVEVAVSAVPAATQPEPAAMALSAAMAAMGAPPALCPVTAAVAGEAVQRLTRLAVARALARMATVQPVRRALFQRPVMLVVLELVTVVGGVLQARPEPLAQELPEPLYQAIPMSRGWRQAHV
jgi:hypothetical protein